MYLKWFYRNERRWMFFKFILQNDILVECLPCAKENKNKMENRGILNSHLYQIKFVCLVDGWENILNFFYHFGWWTRKYFKLFWMICNYFKLFWIWFVNLNRLLCHLKGFVLKIVSAIEFLVFEYLRSWLIDGVSLYDTLMHSWNQKSQW